MPKDGIIGKPGFETIGIGNGFGANILQYPAIGKVAKFNAGFSGFLFHKKYQKNQPNGKANQVPSQTLKKSAIDQNIKKLISL